MSSDCVTALRATYPRRYVCCYFEHYRNSSSCWCYDFYYDEVDFPKYQECTHIVFETCFSTKTCRVIGLSYCAPGYQGFRVLQYLVGSYLYRYKSQIQDSRLKILDSNSFNS
jgi:hypothetical protein